MTTKRRPTKSAQAEITGMWTSAGSVSAWSSVCLEGIRTEGETIQPFSAELSSQGR